MRNEWNRRVIVLIYKIGDQEKTENYRGTAYKVCAVFIDLKVAFDNVNRDILWEIIKKKRNKRGAGKKTKGDL